MARRESGYDTAGSQFFILTEDLPALDGHYAAFGRVIEGSLFAEVAKWVLMGLVVIGILEGFVYFLGPLIWHFTYGKRR